MVAATTTVAALRSAAPMISGIKAQVLEVLEAAGPGGLIGDEVRDVLLSRGMKDGSLNTRYSELEREGLIFRNGDTRAAKTGRSQLVMRHSVYASLVAPVVTAGKRRRSPFVSGLMHAARIVRDAGTVEEARALLREELIKAARRTPAVAKT